jgi:hypothetical protein
MYQWNKITYRPPTSIYRLTDRGITFDGRNKLKITYANILRINYIGTQNVYKNHHSLTT